MQELNGLPKIPPTWSWSTINDACLKVQDGTHFSPQNQLAQGAYKYITAKNVRPSGLDLSNVSYLAEDEHRAIYKRCDPKKGDVLLVKDGVNTGDAAVNTLDEEFSLLSSVCLLRPRPALLYSQFLRYYLLSPVGYRMLTGQMTGTAIKRIILGRIKGSPVPIAPLDEQRDIVAEIEKQFSRLDEAVANLKRVKANLKRYKASVLKAAVEGRLFDDCRKGVKSNDWVNKPIDVAIDSLDQGWSPQCDNEPSDRPDAWGVIKTTAVQSMRYLESENKRLPRALRARPKLELVPGDLLMTRAGPRSRVGVVCLVKATRSHLMLCDKVYRIRCKPGVASPAFLELVLNAPNIVDELNQLKTGISDSGVNLTQKRLRELIIPLPSFKEQERIVAEVERRLSVIKELEAAVEADLTRADRLRQSLLARAFRGELCIEAKGAKCP